jgi:hypothetical protein
MRETDWVFLLVEVDHFVVWLVGSTKLGLLIALIHDCAPAIGFRPWTEALSGTFPRSNGPGLQHACFQRRYFLLSTSAAVACAKYCSPRGFYHRQIL